MRNTPTIPKRKSRRRSAPAAVDHAKVLERLGLCRELHGNGWGLTVRSPIDGTTIATVRTTSADDVGGVIDAAAEAFKAWRLVPAPKRGEFVRRIGNKLRERKADLAALITLESGKITQEAL